MPGFARRNITKKEETILKVGNIVRPDRFVTLVLSSLMLLSLAACSSDPAAPSNTPVPQELQLTLSTDPNPPQAGPVSLIVEIKDTQGKPVEGAKVSLTAKHTGMTHGGISGDMVDQGGGRYQASGSFSMSGTWRAEVKASKDGTNPKTQSFDLSVR